MDVNFFRALHLLTIVATCIFSSAEAFAQPFAYQCGTATVIRVPDDVATIQQAIDSSVEGDTILISPGRYEETLLVENKNLTFSSLYLTTGEDDYISETVIDGMGSRVFAIFGVDERTRVIGLTIQNGEDGIFTDSKIQILHNRIINNGDGVDYENGGGICRSNFFSGNTDDAIDLDFTTEVNISDNTIHDNHDDGIEIRMHPYTGSLLRINVTNNSIMRNLEDGIQIIDYPNLSDRLIRIEGNIIADNATAGLGFMENGNTTENLEGAPVPERVVLLNNTFDGNDHALTGGANLVGANNIFLNSSVLATKNVVGNSLLTNSIFWNNGSNSQNSNITNAISANPLLSSSYVPSKISPAIDAGLSKFMHNNELIFEYAASDFLGTRPDIGAYERECVGSCDTNFPNIDEDGDGVSNCDEIANGTLACPTKPLAKRLLPNSCVGANGFLGHVNFLSLVNHQEDSLTATISFREITGRLVTQRNVIINPLSKLDVNVDQFGLLPETYGSVCVSTDATFAGAWSGDVRQYGNLFTPNSENQKNFSYILRYPFQNPQENDGVAQLNTNSLGNAANAFVANWISLIDANAADGEPLTGTIYFYDVSGKCVGQQAVGIPNGGRFDYSAHDLLGQNQVGTAVFEKNRNSSAFHISVTRYYIEPTTSGQQLINTAYVVTGLDGKESKAMTLSGVSTTGDSHLSILELTNKREISNAARIKSYLPNGNTQTDDFSVFLPLSSLHRIFSNSDNSSRSSALVQMPTKPTSLASSLLTYRILPLAKIYSVVSTPLQYSEGKQQIVDFNSFLNLKNELRIANLSNNQAAVSVQILNYDAVQIASFFQSINAKQTISIELNNYLSAENPTYGTVILRSNEDIAATNFHYVLDGAAAIVVEGKSLLN